MDESCTAAHGGQPLASRLQLQLRRYVRGMNIGALILRRGLVDEAIVERLVSFVSGADAQPLHIPCTLRDAAALETFAHGRIGESLSDYGLIEMVMRVKFGTILGTPNHKWMADVIEDIAAELADVDADVSVKGHDEDVILVNVSIATDERHRRNAAVIHNLSMLMMEDATMHDRDVSLHTLWAKVCRHRCCLRPDLVCLRRRMKEPSYKPEAIDIVSWADLEDQGWPVPAIIHTNVAALSIGRR